MRDSIPQYLFHQGTNFCAYDFFGAHFDKVNGKKGVTFRLWANSAESVSVVGDFNGWNNCANPMTNIGNGVFETFIEGVKEYDCYKYAVKSSKGVVLKADPFAFYTEKAPNTASRVYKFGKFKWTDDDFIKNRPHNGKHHNLPMNVYEVNLTSFKQKSDGSLYTARELAKILVPYVKKMGYNYVEFMPITEYPYDGSWGYQVTGYYSITSRLGTPDDFKYLVNAFHKAGIGVIVDWVPAHFPKDEHGLYEFDGAPLYENHGWDRIEHKTWGTRRFDYGRTEVQSFLISSACFLIDEYHIDGIRVDAVASMLYLDYDKQPDEWIPNEFGDNKNLEAIAFLKKLNDAVHGKFPYVIMIAEESTDYNMITKPTQDGGLGFDYKWNMGWMNDVLSYLPLDPYFRRYDHNKLNFSLCYAFSEHYVLPISHDEVVHGKKSLLDKQFGSYEQKFAGVRAFMGYMMSHPGKKLMFMGQEFGQFKEWAYKEGLEFFMKDYDKHNRLSIFFKELNNFYLNEPCLYGDDDGWDGFNWLEPNDADNNVLTYERRYNGDKLVCIINFSGEDKVYRVGLDRGKYDVVFSSDKIRYGGNASSKKRVYQAKRKEKWQGKDSFADVKIAALSFAFLKKRK